ncbi:NAD(P)/FAD-dependent oxidoreductase [Nitratidesulfovibrio vulgaris]|uniref:NAD(P)/FAD-dependent oxidoreductase n=1 Tax=Nitratidesulfovibrio vulgaris TaxID=881 RepID=UPI0013DE9210|nr:FAD-dependent oxidoreductase [Nitratidesulfovibrio vulgaris]WCB46205.1 FAD-dependent oxidoreductase [Nitratidesulfovibrio vulgaris]
MSDAFDVIVVGGGPAGLFASYYLAEHSGLKVCLIERGQSVRKRGCPIAKTQKCMKCEPCHILSGMGGGGLFSDGKLNFIHKLGKTDLTQFLPRSQAEALIDETETIFNRFGMDGPVFPSDMDAARDIRKQAKKHGIDLLLIKQKHLGSDCLPDHIFAMCEHLAAKGVTIRTGEEVRTVTVENGSVRGVVTDKGEYVCKSVIVAPGRVGADWVGELARGFGLNMSQRGIEVGVRVETHNDVMRDITDVIYDPTFFVQTTKYDDQTRTFCTNPAGFIALENYQDFVCVNGHAYRNRKSENTNFAFLSKVVLTDPVSDNTGYGTAIGRLATIIGGGKPILQRLGDLRRGRRSTWQRIKNGYIEPTLMNVVPGDIAMALPERIVTNLVDGLEQLNNVIPGIADDGTLLYAPEIKFFATQVETDSHLETGIRGLFVAGDGPGVAGNIVSAAATGIIPAKAIIEREGA